MEKTGDEYIAGSSNFEASIRRRLRQDCSNLRLLLRFNTDQITAAKNQYNDLCSSITDNKSPDVIKAYYLGYIRMSYYYTSNYEQLKHAKTMFQETLKELQTL